MVVVIGDPVFAAGYFKSVNQSVKKRQFVHHCLSCLLGMRQTISVDALINYLKEWCVRPESDDSEQRLAEDESEGANFTSTVQHIHNVYTYLHTNCPQSSLKELFQHTPAVFIEYNRYVGSCISTLFEVYVFNT